MKLLQELCKTALPFQCKSKYKGITFDGCYFYLTCPDLCQIVKCDNCFCEVECFKTSKPYSCICYSLKENCFWVSVDCNYDKIFKLDCCFNEIDCITVHSECCGTIITGISYDCTENRLIVAFANCILSVDTTGCQEEQVLQKTCSTWNMDILSVSPSYLTIEMDKMNQCIAVYNCHRELKCKIEIPYDYFAESIIFNPCKPHCDGKYYFYLLATKSCCYSYVLEFFIDCNDLEICSCNYKLCDKEQCKPCCPKPLTNTCNDLIESVALIETSLSHILNAEGEKLQKIILCSDDIDKILCANQSINDTIVKITHLEIILHDKLTTIKDYCHICECEKHCNHTCDCEKHCSHTCDCEKHCNHTCDCEKHEPF